MTGSDDGSFKLVDVRLAEDCGDEEEASSTVLKTNKKHNAGVTCLHEVTDNLILSGSYDKTL